MMPSMISIQLPGAANCDCTSTRNQALVELWTEQMVECSSRALISCWSVIKSLWPGGRNEYEPT